ncbi:hypothetical protein [Nocardia asiatica]|uniref:hypothetical protein n=1 Tax=Nocardia asiatica TaxID=209252 RepID=UPI003EE23C3C
MRDVGWLILVPALFGGLMLFGGLAALESPREAPSCYETSTQSGPSPQCVREHKKVVADRRTERDTAIQLVVAGGVILGVLGVGLVFMGRRSRPGPESDIRGRGAQPIVRRHPPASPAPPSPPGPDDFRLLLLMSGSRETAESLIAFERKLLPRADRATLIAKAIERLRRDRDRQG